MNEVFEIVIRALAELMFGLLIRGPGWMIVRRFRQSDDVNADGCFVFLVGLLFWIVLGALIGGITLLL